MGMLREAALKEKGRCARIIHYFLGKIAKFSITEKWHMECFVSQKMNTLLAGMALSNHRARCTTKSFYKEYIIYPVKITSLCWNLR